MKKPHQFAAIFFLTFLVWSAWNTVFSSQTLSLSFFDVDQGDAAFIQTPQGHQILIDGGPDDAILKKLEESMPWWDRDIDLIMLSHPAADHVTGLLSVLEKYHVQHIVWTGVQRDTAVFKEWVRALDQEQKEGAVITLAQSGQRIAWQNQGCLQHIDILFPFEEVAGTMPSDDNDTSIVAKLVWCNHSALFTGDLTSKKEQEMVERNVDLDADILKVGHHGSKTSSSREFLWAVSPGIAVISSGKQNRYGHPHEEVLARFEQFGIQVMRTDESGDIILHFK